jgi:hypothetical protein
MRAIFIISGTRIDTNDYRAVNKASVGSSDRL